MVPKTLQAKELDCPVEINARINVKADNTGAASKILLNTSFPETGWDFRISLNQSEPEKPEIFLHYNHTDFFSQFGSIYVKGLLKYLENPFFVNNYEDFFSPVSVSLSPVSIAAFQGSRKYPELLLGWKIRGNWSADPLTLYTYVVSPGLNELTHYRTGVLGTMQIEKQIVQIGALLHGIESSKMQWEDDNWYSQNLQPRSYSKEGLSAGVTLFKENDFSGSGIIGLISLDSYRQSGFMAGGALTLTSGLLNLKYFQSIYSPAYPIIYTETPQSRSALHSGKVILKLPRILSISMEIAEELQLINWNYSEQTEAERSCTTAAELVLGISLVKIKDFIRYTYPADGQEFSVLRVLDTEYSINLKTLRIVMNFSAVYIERQLEERDKSVELIIKKGNMLFSYMIEFSGNVQKSSFDFTYTKDALQLTLTIDTSGKYQAAVTAEI
ncbi:MAG: hypothetical protein ISR78_03495 [Spirochaetia bacterium]|nr:hypothetical protein [Spirochaetia bacterium]